MKFAYLATIAVLLPGSQAKFDFGGLDPFKPKHEQSNSNVDLSLD